MMDSRLGRPRRGYGGRKWSFADGWAPREVPEIPIRDTVRLVCVYIGSAQSCRSIAKLGMISQPQSPDIRCGSQRRRATDGCDDQLIGMSLMSAPTCRFHHRAVQRSKPGHGGAEARDRRLGLTLRPLDDQWENSVKLSRHPPSVSLPRACQLLLSFSKPLD